MPNKNTPLVPTSATGAIPKGSIFSTSKLVRRRASSTSPPGRTPQPPLRRSLMDDQINPRGSPSDRAAHRAAMDLQRDRSTHTLPTGPISSPPHLQGSRYNVSPEQKAALTTAAQFSGTLTSGAVDISQASDTLHTPAVSSRNNDGDTLIGATSLTHGPQYTEYTPPPPQTPYTTTAGRPQDIQGGFRPMQHGQGPDPIATHLPLSGPPHRPPLITDTHSHQNMGGVPRVTTNMQPPGHKAEPSSIHSQQLPRPAARDGLLPQMNGQRLPHFMGAWDQGHQLHRPTQHDLTTNVHDSMGLQANIQHQFAHMLRQIVAQQQQTQEVLCHLVRNQGNAPQAMEQSFNNLRQTGEAMIEDLNQHEMSVHNAQRLRDLHQQTLQLPPAPAVVNQPRPQWALDPDKITKAAPSFDPSEAKSSFKETWDKLVVYGRMCNYTDDDYLWALGILIHGDAYTTFGGLCERGATLKEILKHFADRYVSQHTIEDDLAALDSFERQANETIRAAMSRYIYLLDKTAHATPPNKWPGLRDAKLEETLSSICSNNAFKELKRRTTAARSQGYYISYDAMLKIVDQEERVRKEIPSKPTPLKYNINNVRCQQSNHPQYKQGSESTQLQHLKREKFETTKQIELMNAQFSQLNAAVHDLQRGRPRSKHDRTKLTDIRRHTRSQSQERRSADRQASFDRQRMQSSSPHRATHQEKPLTPPAPSSNHRPYPQRPATPKPRPATEEEIKAYLNSREGRQQFPQQEGFSYRPRSRSNTPVRNHVGHNFRRRSSSRDQLYRSDRSRSNSRNRFPQDQSRMKHVFHGITTQDIFVHSSSGNQALPFCQTCRKFNVQEKHVCFGSTPENQ